MMKRLFTPRRGAAAILALVIVADIAAAQQPSVPAATAACVPASPTGVAALEGRTNVLYATAELGYKAPDSVRLYTAYLLEEFAKEFRYPTPHAFTAWSSLDSLTPAEASPVLAGEAMVVIRPTGEVRNIALTQTSLHPAIDAALIAALRKAVESDEILPPSSLKIRNDFTLYIALTFEPELDLIPGAVYDRPSQTKPLTPARRTVRQPLIKFQVPAARFSAPLRADQNASKPVRFPPDLVAMARDGDVTVQFVVGPDGRITPGTVRIIGATERGFANGVIRALGGLRFFPGEIGGCPVSVLATQSFSFRIDR
jgi:hypothetical protein